MTLTVLASKRRPCPRAARPAAIVLGLLVWVCAWPSGAGEGEPRSLTEIMDALGHAEYLTRQRATDELLTLGDDILAAARERLLAETDPEIRYRLRFVLESISIPIEAVLVLKAAGESGLEPGDLITHINNHRVRRSATAQQLLNEADIPDMLRIRGRNGPRDAGPLREVRSCRLVDYAPPHGPEVAQIVRLFADGYAEEAYDRLLLLPGPLSENELPPEFSALLAYVAGQGDVALRKLQDSPHLVEWMGVNRWAGPSQLDMAAPVKAPFHLELALWRKRGVQINDASTGFFEPDISVQRVLVPAGRYLDSFERSARSWLQSRDFTKIQLLELNAVGNMLAVCAWMLHELELHSECVRLIEPRSALLRMRPVLGVGRWLRVDTDAWLPFLQGHAKKAIDLLYPDALSILQFPESDQSVIRNPEVAAMVAFFLAQAPQDERAGSLVGLLNRPDHRALPRYAWWLQFAVTDRNEAFVRGQLEQLLKVAKGANQVEILRALARLAYARPGDNPGALGEWLKLVGPADAAGKHAAEAAALAVLDALGRDDLSAAGELLAERPEEARLRPLRHTLRYRQSPPAAAQGRPELTAPLSAAPLGAAGEWLVLTRTHQLMRVGPGPTDVAPLDPPSATWYPGPATWPWIGCDDGASAAWVYDRRRLMVVHPRDATVPGAPALMNITPADIERIEAHLAPCFKEFLACVATRPTPVDENGEYLRHEILANGEYVSDPLLPEIAFIRPLPEHPRFVHVALRGGPHLIADRQSRRTWTSTEIAAQLELSEPLTFHVRATPEKRPPAYARLARDAGAAAPDADQPVLVLLSNQGLIRLDVDEASAQRIPLPTEPRFPALLPENCPYERRDPRWIYLARLPEEGGAVYRLRLADNRIEPLDLINETLPREHFAMQARSELRRQLDGRLALLSHAGLDVFVNEAIERIREHLKPRP